MPAVGHHDEARFLAGQEFLDHHARAGGAHRMPDEHRVDRRVRFGNGLRDDDALACGQAVRLDDDGRTLARNVVACRGGIGERPVAAGWNAVPRHEALREILRAFELRCRLGDAEHFETRRAERVHDAGGKRSFRTDDGQRDRFLDGELGEIGDRRARNVGDAGLARSATVARRHEHFRDARRLRELPGKRMLASTAADDENVHARSLRGCPLVQGDPSEHVQHAAVIDATAEVRNVRRVDPSLAVAKRGDRQHDWKRDAVEDVRPLRDHRRVA